MTPPSFCTVQAVKSYVVLGRGSVSDDPLLATMIQATSAAIESYINRTILAADYTEVRDGTGTGTIVLANTPIISVASIGIGSPPATRVALTANTDYILGRNTIRLLGGVFPRGVANVAIAYNGGYATVPLDIADCCAKWTALRYRQLERIGQNSKTMANETVTFDTDAMPKDVALILSDYKRVAQVGAS